MEKSLPDQMKEKLHQIFGNDGTEKDGITTYQSDEDGLITQALLKEKEGVVEIRIAYHDEDTDEGIDLPEPAYIFNITSQDIKRIEDAVITCKNDIERMVIDMDEDENSEQP